MRYRLLQASVGIALLLLSIPVSVAADFGGDRAGVGSPYTSLRTPRLDVSLLSVETAGFVGATVTFFTVAATDRSSSFAPVWAGAGVATLIMSAWSTGLLVRSSRELRWRRLGTTDAKRSSRLNRWMIAYDVVMASAYIGLSIPIAVSGAPSATSSPRGANIACGITVNTTPVAKKTTAQMKSTTVGYFMPGEYQSW